MKQIIYRFWLWSKVGLPRCRSLVSYEYIVRRHFSKRILPSGIDMASMITLSGSIRQSNWLMGYVAYMQSTVIAYFKIDMFLLQIEQYGFYWAKINGTYRKTYIRLGRPNYLHRVYK